MTRPTLPNAVQPSKRPVHMLVRMPSNARTDLRPSATAVCADRSTATEATWRSHTKGETQMKVFVSWSGERSKLVAEGLRKNLKLIDNAIEPFMSELDVGPGRRWISELNRELESTKVGIICLTCENLQTPWLLFEAGSVSKSVSETCVLPYLLDVQCSGLPEPLRQFQSVKADKEGTKNLVLAIYRSLGNESRLSKEEIEEGFETRWTDSLMKVIQGAAGQPSAIPYDVRKLLTPPRTEPCYTEGSGRKQQPTSGGYAITQHYNEQFDQLVSYVNASQNPGDVSIWHRLKATPDKRPYEARYFAMRGAAQFDVLINARNRSVRSFSLDTGDSLLIPDSMWCRFRTTSSEPLQMLVVCIPRWQYECYEESESMPVSQ